MLKAFLNIWRIPELRNKILFTLGMLCIYRIGFYIPLPGVDQSIFAKQARQAQEGNFGDLLTFMNIFTGGTFNQSTIFGLGVMPYISASIIFQLLSTVLESMKQLKKEGPAGQQKIQEWTRYATVGLCIIQGSFWLNVIQSGSTPMVYLEWRYSPLFWVMGVASLTAGAVFLMWLGEQIDKFGIGNGVSLIITAGILSRMHEAVMLVASRFSVSSSEPGSYSLDTVLFLVAAFVFVIAGAIVITQGQRRIPIQQAKHTRGRRVYGGQKTYLPLRVNHGGVMPIIFASSLLIFPSAIFNYFSHTFPESVVWRFLADNINMSKGGYLYIVLYIAMIYFFSFFWTTVQFQPKEMADHLRDHGSFIPGLRPGPRTAEYLEVVMERITYVGAGFLAVIAVIPTVISQLLHIDYAISAFLGGTGLLIVISVMLDFVQRIEATLMMRNYQGFLGGGTAGGRGRRIRGARSI